MNIAAAHRGIMVTLLVLPLAACQAPGIRDDATGDLGAVPEERPGDVYAEMGREYMRQGLPAVALTKLKYGLEVDPKNPQIHANLGRLYEQLGETQLADKHYSEAAYRAPKDPYIHNAWGSFLCQQGEYDQADEQFRLALQNPLYRQPWAANTNAGVCALRAGRPEQAETYLLHALSITPRIPLALQKMARISSERGEYETAKVYIERYRELAPHTPETLLLGLRIEQGLGDADGIARYRAVLENRFPDSLETRTAKELSQP
jgi:type IV pilus assembly protein PilF